MASLVTPLLTETLGTTGKTRFVATNTNLKVNGCLLDCSFTVPETYTSKWDFLKSVYLDVVLRLGAENGGAVTLIRGCSLYTLLSYSDYKAGVSMKGTNFTQGEVARISAYLPFGFFAMGSRDALEVALNVGDSSVIPSTGVKIAISSVYRNSELNNFKVYTESAPTGADQPYKNVLELYYIGEEVVNQNINITDQQGAKTVNIEDCIAYSNSVGAFEFFTRMGMFYNEEFGISQDLSFRVPNTDSKAKVLVVQYAFYPSMLVSNAGEMSAERNSLIAKIRENDSEKYDYLVAIGRA